MIQAVLVDDERLALIKLELMLKESPDVQIAGTFIDPLEAIRALPALKPDVIFLDIDMPEIDGLEAAIRILEICPQTEIVFVTAYNKYALEAFEVNALDYVLKPVRHERFHKTLMRLKDRLSRSAKVQSGPEMAIMIGCLQSLRFLRGGRPIEGMKWRTAKAQELFAYLLHNRNRFVSKDRLIELLWPDFQLKQAYAHLYTTIYQVRQCLKQAGVELQLVNADGGGYSLLTEGIRIDAVEWEQGIFQLGTVNAINSGSHQKLFELYTGDYLGSYDYMWAESERQRLRTILLHHGAELAEYYAGCGRALEAITVYRKIVELQPFFEQGHWGLMKLYESVGEHAAVEEQYHTLENLLSEELGIAVPSAIEQWYAQWRGHKLKML